MQTIEPAKKGPCLNEVERLLLKYPLSSEIPHYGYGTAGFRFKAKFMHGLMVRVGVIAALRVLEAKMDIGVMITASHNDESYNGVKLADPDGGMLDVKFEGIAEEIANEANASKIIDRIKAGISGEATQAVVHVGRDTRSHSPVFSELVVRCILAMGVTVRNHGIVTTPMLHHCVLHANAETFLPAMIPTKPNESGYYDLLTTSYIDLLNTIPDKDRRSKQCLVVDCACGVGFGAADQINKRIMDGLRTTAPILLARNSPEDGPLNQGCGSEHVQKSIAPPLWYDGGKGSTYCAALDGDADRIVFFSEQGKDFFLLDGDKITSLLCEFLQSQLEALYALYPGCQRLSLGVVQTAYANGASSAFLKQILGPDNVAIAKTGVKHVHHTAKEFDIGVYFEANGHGTILFGDGFLKLIDSFPAAARVLPEWKRLRLLPSLINQAVGDALSDLLLVDFILHLRGWTLREWNGIYSELPSRQLKVQVRDRSVIKTNDTEEQCLQPAAVQPALDAAMKECNGRSFIRPSGTEDVVRVYAEAPSQRDVDALAAKAVRIVYDFCGGLGDPPLLSQL